MAAITGVYTAVRKKILYCDDAPNDCSFQGFVSVINFENCKMAVLFYPKFL